MHRTGFVWDEEFLRYDVGAAAGYLPAGGWLERGHPGDSPDRVQRVYHLLHASGLLAKLATITPRKATHTELLRAHDTAYLAGIRAASEAHGGDAGEGTPFGPGSYEIARLAAGACIEAVEAVLDGQVRNAYALVRPPGHHAERGRGRGGCLLGNLTVAAWHALVAHGLERVAVLDWDVHHGNGAQQAFWTNPKVFTISIHQDSNFPADTGATGEVGARAGLGYNLNIPMPPGSGVGAYRTSFQQLVAPALLSYAPQLILIASGLDASAFDPFGRMMLHSEAFRELTSIVAKVADTVCDGRIVACHEGGYASEYVPFCALAIIEELAGERTQVVDPFLADLQQLGRQELQPEQAAAIARAAESIIPRPAGSPSDEPEE